MYIYTYIYIYILFETHSLSLSISLSLYIYIYIIHTYIHTYTDTRNLVPTSQARGPLEFDKKINSIIQYKYSITIFIESIQQFVKKIIKLFKYSNVQKN